MSSVLEGEVPLTSVSVTLVEKLLLAFKKGREFERMNPGREPEFHEAAIAILRAIEPKAQDE